MTQVTYIAMTPEMLEEAVSKSAKIAVDRYAEDIARGDLRSINYWVGKLNLDRRTIMTRIEKGIIKVACDSPYRISRYEMEKWESAGQP